MYNSLPPVLADKGSLKQLISSRPLLRILKEVSDRSLPKERDHFSTIKSQGRLTNHILMVFTHFPKTQRIKGILKLAESVKLKATVDSSLQMQRYFNSF